MGTDELAAQIAELDRSIATMRTYLLHKYDLDDWHGVMDAAADLRELVVRRNVLADVAVSAFNVAEIAASDGRRVQIGKAVSHG